MVTGTFSWTKPRPCFGSPPHHGPEKQGARETKARPVCLWPRSPAGSSARPCAQGRPGPGDVTQASAACVHNGAQSLGRVGSHTGRSGATGARPCSLLQNASQMAQPFQQADFPTLGLKRPKGACGGLLHQGTPKRLVSQGVEWWQEQGRMAGGLHPPGPPLGNTQSSRCGLSGPHSQELQRHPVPSAGCTKATWKATAARTPPCLQLINSKHSSY